MSVHKKKPYLTPSLPRQVTRYRNIDNSSSYLPHFFNRAASPKNVQNLIIVDEQEENSSGE